MALKSQIVRPVVNTGILLVLFLSLLAQPLSASAKGHPDVDALPNFSEFSNAVQDGSADLPRGVYVPNLLALPIVQQPAGNPGFVSKQDGKVTQFSMANKYGNVGLLAHNYLAGKSFSELAIGDEVRLVYGDGRVERSIKLNSGATIRCFPDGLRGVGALREIGTDTLTGQVALFAKAY